MLRNLALAAVLAFAATPALAAEPAHDMKAMSHATVSGEGSGTVKSVDAAKRSVVIVHGPIASLQWPGIVITSYSIHYTKLYDAGFQRGHDEETDGEPEPAVLGQARD